MCFRGKGGLGGPPHVQPGNVHLCIPLVRDHVCVCVQVDRGTTLWYCTLRNTDAFLSLQAQSALI